MSRQVIRLGQEIIRRTMGAPISFKGTDYDSVEAMPPNIRAAYEQSQSDKARNQPGQEKSQPQGQAPAGSLRPDWSRPRPHESVPLPEEFHEVTSLGPLATAHQHHGIKRLPNFGTPRATWLVRYRDGLAYQASGKDVHTWRWDEECVKLKSWAVALSAARRNRSNTQIVARRACPEPAEGASVVYPSYSG